MIQLTYSLIAIHNKFLFVLYLRGYKFHFVVLLNILPARVQNKPMNYFNFYTFNCSSKTEEKIATG